MTKGKAFIIGFSALVLSLVFAFAVVSFAQIDVNGVCVTEQIVQVSQDFLVGPDKKGPKDVWRFFG